MMTTASAALCKYQHINVTPMCGALGAEITGVDLSAPIAAVVRDEIHRAFLEYSAIVLREQDLAPDAQIAFTKIFGDVVRHPLYRSAEIESHPEILVIEHKSGEFFNGRNDVWHSDLTFQERPPLGSVLHCRAVWAGFGDTLFANQYLAYEELSDTLKSALDGMQGVHTAALLAERNNADTNNVPITEIQDPVVQPVVRTHPETGRKSLYVNAAFTTGIVGVPHEESNALLAFLHNHSTQHRFIYRHRWRVGDVVMFDNRCLMHYVVLDFPAQMHRRMHRTTAAGDRPG
jgi:taurine dioxygenase